MARPRKKPDESLEQTAKRVTRKAAPKATAKPKGDRKPVKRLTTAQAAKRNAEMVLDRMVRGRSWVSISVKYDLDESTCRRIVAQHREANMLGLDEIDQKSETWEILAGHDAQIERYYDLRERAEAMKNLNAELGAETGIRATRQARTDLLQQVGALPKELGQLRIEFEVRQVVQKIMLVLTRVENGDIEPGDAKRELATMVGNAQTAN